ncbi:MAG: hypothetical protein Q8L28_00995 [bacterium]|nr:hypothetical protein [bacterium]
METKLFSREENFSFWKNMILVLVFFIITPTTLGISLFSLVSINKSLSSKVLQTQAAFVEKPQYGLRVYASLPLNIPAVGGQVGASDARGQIIKSYLERWNSPMASLSEYIVQISDKYDLDYRLVTAISQQESNVCKIIPPGSYNCWGWGIHSKGTLGFSSYEEGVETVSKGLREEYLNKGYKTVEEIMSKYTPMSNGSWANGVNSFMSDMQ